MAVATLCAVLVAVGAPSWADFQAAGSHSTGEGFPEAVTTGDFDGDGVVDLAVVPADRDRENGVIPSIKVGVLSGRGDGTFSTPTEHQVGERPRDIVAADFDGDGRADLATANFDTSDVSVLRNQGAGAFAAARSYDVGTSPRALNAADFNGDGRADLAVVNFNSEDISLLLGRSDGSLAPAISSPAGPAPISLATADFNHDGRLDLAVGNLVTDTPAMPDKEVSILLGNGAGGFDPSGTVDVGADADSQSGRGAQPLDLVAADLDGDGSTDLAAAVSPDTTAVNQPKQRVTVLRGRGDATFDPFRSYPAGAEPSALAAGDLDGDGRLDLVVANAGSGNISVLRGGPGGEFTPIAGYAAGGRPSSVVIADLDGDGKLDIAVANTSSGSVTVLLGNGDATLVGARTSPTGGAGPTDLAAGDFDGDGLTDLAVTNSGLSASHVAVMYGSSDGNLRLGPALSTSHTPRSVAAADFNRDGSGDLVVASWNYPQDSNPGWLSIFLRAGTGFTRTNRSVGARPGAIVVADLNGDPDLDVAVLTEPTVTGQPSTVWVLFGAPAGAFPGPAVAFPAGARATSLVAADLNSDGITDMAIGNPAGADARPSVSVLLGTGGGGFAAPIPQPVDVSPDVLASADFDGDHRADMAVAGLPAAGGTSGDDQPGNVQILFGIPSETGSLFRSSPLHDVGTRPGSAVAGDLDVDGDADLAVTTASGVDVLSNTGGGAFSAPIHNPVGLSPTALVAGPFGGGASPDLAVVNLGGSNNPVSNTVSVLVDTPGPGAPTGIRAEAGNRSAVVHWTPPTDSGDAPLAAYTVSVHVGASQLTTLSVPVGQQSVVVGGLANGTPYRFRVAATDAAGVTGRRSAPSGVVVPATVPSAPSSVVAEAGNGTASLRWEPPADNGGLAVTRYTVTTLRGGDESASTTTADARTTAVVPGLVNGTEYTFRVAAVNPAGTGPASAPSNAVTPLAPPSPPPTEVVSDPPPGRAVGYRLTGSDGGVFAFGGARFLGSTGALRLASPVVGMAATPSGAGYWLVAADGGVFAFGDARFLGSTGGRRLASPVVGMAATPSGAGYWLVAADGGVFAFGDARFVGSTGARRLNQPMVGMAASPSGKGYRLVARDGGIFAFGDASFLGSTGAINLNQPIVGTASTPSGNGYWLVARDGGVFAFGDARFLGSAGGLRLNSAVVAMAAA